MNINQDGFSQIAVTLARHFECLYYINIETGEYTTFVPLQMYKDLHIPEQGDDFFAQEEGMPLNMSIRAISSRSLNSTTKLPC